MVPVEVTMKLPEDDTKRRREAEERGDAKPDQVHACLDSGQVSDFLEDAFQKKESTDHPVSCTPAEYQKIRVPAVLSTRVPGTD